MHATNNRRHNGIDACRAVGAFLVALLHALYLTNSSMPPMVYELALLLTRGAVPFFFVVSGYFLRTAEPVGREMFRRPLQRLVPVYLVWFTVYLVVEVAVTGHVEHRSALNWLFGGPGFHLWFLPVLGASIVAVSFARSLFGDKVTGLVCIVLAIAGLVGGAYHAAILGAVGGRGMITSPLLVFAGAMLRKHVRDISPWAGLAFLVAAYGFFLVEEAALAAVSGLPFHAHEIPVGAILVGVAAMILARSLPHDGLPWAASVGRMTLGIYGVHLLFVNLFVWLLGAHGFACGVLIAILSFAASVLAISALRFVRPLRFLAE